MKSFGQKALIIFLLISFITAFSACGDRSSSKNSNSSVLTQTQGTSQNGTNEAVDIWEKYEPTIEVSSAFFEPSGFKIEPGATLEDNIWTKSLQDELGIKIKYTWSAPLSQAQQKMNIAIASNDLPDIIPAYDLVQFKQLVDNGVAMDMTGLMDTYLDPFAREQIFGDGGAAIEQLKVNGKIMAIAAPKVQLGDTAILWIRADWLKNLGLETPKTIADVLKISEAFTKNDPDKNGQNDTYGFGLDKNFGGLKGFFEGYHTYPYDNFWVKDASGELVYGSIQPEVKTALQQLALMYKDGQIDQEFAVKDSQKAQELIVAGKVGMYYGGQADPFMLKQCKDRDPESDWTPYPIVSIDDSPAKPATTPGVNTWIYAINNKMAHPEAAVKITNYMMKKDNIFSKDYDSAYHVLKADDVSYNRWHLMPMRISASSKTHHEIYENVEKYLETKDQTYISIQDIKNNAVDVEAYLNGDVSKWQAYRWCGPGGAWSVIVNDYRDKNIYQQNGYYKSPTDTAVTKGVTLNKMQVEVFTKIIMGKEPLDNFDEFVDNWKKLGGDDMTKEVNSMK